MTFRVEIEITPDADGMHCMGCRFNPRESFQGCDHFGVWRLETSDGGWRTLRCPACLAAEREWKERQPKARACNHPTCIRLAEGACAEARTGMSQSEIVAAVERALSVAVDQARKEHNP